MKLYITLTILLVLSAFGIGYYSYNISDNYTVSPFDKIELRSLKRDFTRKVEPEVKLVYSELYPSKKYRELLLPTAFFSIQHKNVFFSDKDCFKYINDLSVNFSIGKVVSWEQYRCKRIERLPASFFQYPPFIHPNGMSYVFLLYKRFGEEKISKEWLMRHLRYLTIKELQYFKKKWKSLPKVFDTLSSLNEEGVKNLVEHSNIFINKDKVFLLDWDIFSFFEGTYKIYPLEKFKNYIKNSKFVISDEEGKCLVKEANICWNFSLAHIIDKTGYMNISMTIVLFIFVVLSCFAIYSQMAAERKEDEKRKFALRILGHELRTPVSGMMVKLETLLNGIDKYDEDDQVQILKISSDAHRLRRLIEMSRNYLTASQKSGKKEGIHQVESIQFFCERFYDDYPMLDVQHESGDFHAEVDEYWLQVCVKNLVENAFFHGAEPVVLKTFENKNRLYICVEDAGECERDSFSELSQEFFKGNKSHGTGLGLNIVKKILKDMKLNIEFQTKPTRFSIVIERNRYGKSINS